MSNLPAEIQAHAKIFVEANAMLEQRNKELKETKTTIARCKREFKKYMLSHNLKSMCVAGKTFMFEPSEKVVLTLDRVEQAFPESQVKKYKEENTEKKTTFTCS